MIRRSRRRDSGWFRKDQGNSLSRGNYHRVLFLAGFPQHFLAPETYQRRAGPPHPRRTRSPQQSYFQPTTSSGGPGIRTLMGFRPPVFNFCRTAFAALGIIESIVDERFWAGPASTLLGCVRCSCGGTFHHTLSGALRFSESKDRRCRRIGFVLAVAIWAANPGCAVASAVFILPRRSPVLRPLHPLLRLACLKCVSLGVRARAGPYNGPFGGPMGFKGVVGSNPSGPTSTRRGFATP